MRKLIQWLFFESQGLTSTATAVILSVKLFYLITRVFLRVFLGKDRRDCLYLERRLDFNFFWDRCIKFLAYTNPGKLLKFKSRKYNYVFYCRNGNDFRVMTLHEEQLIDLFRPVTGDTVIDVGAHIGNYTLISSKRVGPHGKVIAIEPDPNNFDILNQNIRLNCLNNVLILNCALSSETSNVKLHTFQQRSELSLYNSIMPTRATKGEYIEVLAETLDNILEKNSIELTKISWIKIDVEGAELEVLKGAHNTLSGGRNISLLIEVHNISEGNSLYEPISEFLDLHGFKITFERDYDSGEKHIIATK